MELVLLHGLGGAPSDFDHLVSMLPPSWTVQRLSLPGHGDGAQPLPAKPTLAGLGTSVASRVPARHQASSFRVAVGHSSGGIVLLDAVARGAIDCDRLVLIDSNAPLSDDGRLARSRKVALARSEQWRDHLLTSMAQSMGSLGLAERSRLLAGLDSTPDSVLQAIWMIVLSSDADEAWLSCLVPVLYVRTTRSVDVADAALKRTGGALEVTVLDESLGHWPHLTAPQAVTEAIVAFVASAEHPHSRT